MSSSLQVGLRCARLCAFRGLLLRWLLLLCHSRHGRRPGPQKTTQQQHKRAASLGWGFAALAAGLPGCCCGGCCRATRTPDQQQQHKRAPSLGWGFAALANAPTGCCCGGCCCYATAGTTEGRAHKRQHNSSTKEQLLWGGASLRSPLAFRGAAAVDPAAAAGLLEHRTNNSSTKEQLLWGGASLRSPLAFRGAAAVDPAAAAGLLEQRTFAGLLEQRTFAGLLEQRTFAGLLEQRTFAGLLEQRTPPSASASPPSASVFTSPLPPARC